MTHGDEQPWSTRYSQRPSRIPTMMVSFSVMQGPQTPHLRNVTKLRKCNRARDHDRRYEHSLGPQASHTDPNDIT